MEDEILDKEMDKIFHDEKETLSKLNPSAGELDEERKNYYRCYILVWPQQSFMLFSPLRSASSDDTATSEKQFASPAAEAEPMTGESSSVFVRHVDHVRQIIRYYPVKVYNWPLCIIWPDQGYRHAGSEGFTSGEC